MCLLQQKLQYLTEPFVLLLAETLIVYIVWEQRHFGNAITAF